MKNIKLIKKYIEALKKSYGTNPLNGDTLQVHTKTIQNTIKKLENDNYEPTALDTVWVDYFLK